jgi:hypothetical protein
MALTCQLLEAGWRFSVSYIRQDSGSLQDVCVYFVCYLQRDGCNLSVTRGRMAIACQLHEIACRVVCTLSVT